MTSSTISDEASQSSCPQLDHEDLDQVDEYDLEEMDLKWQVAMISMRIKKFYKKTGRKLQFDAKEPVGFDKTKVECYNCHKTGHFARECRTKEDNRRRDGWNPGNKDGSRTGKKEESKALVTVDGESVDWTTHSEDDENFAFMASNSSGSDTQRRNKGLYSDLDDKTDVLTYHKKLLAKAQKEKDDLEVIVDKWNHSSKNLGKIVNYQMSASDKFGLGYGDYRYSGILSYENEVSQSVFNCNKCDSENPTLHKRLGKTSEMKAVPPPMTGNYFPSRPDIEIDDSPTLLMGSRGNTTMPELHNKMELLRERNRNLIEAGKDHALQIYFFLKHFLGLKQLVMLVMDLKKEDESAQDCFELPIWHSYSSTNPFASKSDNKIGGPREEEQVFLDDLARLQRQEKEANEEAEALRKNLEQETENLGYSGRNIPVVLAELMRDYYFDTTNSKEDDSEITPMRIFMKDTLLLCLSDGCEMCPFSMATIVDEISDELMGELTFFLGLQVKQKPDGIFISQDKYVAEILKKFDFASVKTASTPIETQKPLVKVRKQFQVHSKTFILSAVKEFLGNPQQEVVNFLAGDSLLGNGKKQTIVATSTTEAICCAACCVGKFYGIQIKLYHSKTKHIAIRHHFIRDAYEKKLIQSKNTLVKHFEDMRLCRPSKEYLLVWFDPSSDVSMSCLTTKGMHTIGEITKLKKQAKPVIKHFKAYLKTVSLQQRLPRKSSSKKHRMHKESVSKQGRKIAKGESSVQRDPLFDVMPEDKIDHMETENAQSEGRTREMVDEDKEIDEVRLSTEDVVSTDKEGVSTDFEKVSTDFEKVSTDKPIVSTDGSKVSTDEQIEGTDEQVEGTEEIFESTEEQREGTEEKVESTAGQTEGTEDQTKEEVANQASQTSSQTPTSMIFGDDETIATLLLNMCHANVLLKGEKEKGGELKDIDPKDKGKKKIEEEDESESEDDDIPQAVKKFKQLESDEVMARKIQEEWEAEEERNKIAEEKATNEALIKNFDDIKARIEADRILAEKLQEQEREQFTIEERAKFLHDTIAAQRKFLAQQRTEAIRNRPPTKNQLRNQMMTYLKHVGNFKHSELKSKKFEDIQAMYEKIKRSDEDFIAIGSVEDDRLIKRMKKKDSSKGEEIKQESKEEVKEEDKGEENTRKRKHGTRKKMKSRKRRFKQDTSQDDPSDSEKENDELRLCLTIAPDEDKEVDYEILDKKYPIIDWKTENLGTKPQIDESKRSEEINMNVVTRSNGQKRSFSTLMRVLSVFDREDLDVVYKLVV
ncbi:ribonuclease H-like domain-containing protein [Tanacetum coccineum]